MLDVDVRPKIRLGEIEKLIKRHRIIVPPLSRSTLIRMCEDGTFETASDPPTGIGWLVYEDSFLNWVESLDRRGTSKKGRDAQ